MVDPNLSKEDLLLANINETDQALELGKQGLLKELELHHAFQDLTTAIERNLVPDSILHRQYLKRRSQTYWMRESIDGFAHPHDVDGKLGRLRDFAVKILEDAGKSLNTHQFFIDKGLVYTGRKLLREILDKAQTTIDIQDNYTHGIKIHDIEILNILEPYTEKTPQIKMRVLTNQVTNAFKSDLQAFNTQFNNAVEMKKHNNCHGRFIIIDSSVVYQVGQSLKDIGKKADLLSEVTVQSEKDKIKNDFETWWNTGTSI